jgi:cytochrome P450
MAFGLAHAEVAFALLRAVWPIPHVGKYWLLTRNDHVREAFLNDPAFAVPYEAKLDVIMGGEKFFLGMRDTPAYRRDTAAMRKVVRPADIPARLIPAMNQRAEQVVTAAAGQIEVVDTLARQVTFDVLNAYFGISAPAGGDLRVWATRLFEFQFADQGNDTSLRREVDQIAPALRAHIDALIASRRGVANGSDDVLGRALAMQASLPPGTTPTEAGFSDSQIRCALIGFLVGGVPQPPMVAPQALEQLLRRPDALAGAQDAARRDDDQALAGYVFEALRFDPLAPALPRVATRDVMIAAGTPHAATIPAGANVYVSFASAMRDGRRVADPNSFNHARPARDFIHFGLGLHQCFGLHINMALIPLMLKPLLRRPGLRRASGREGYLTKRGAFAERLWVTWQT